MTALRIVLVALLTTAFASVANTEAQTADTSAQERFQEANRLYERGLRAEGDERATLLRSAAGLFESIVEEDGVRNGHLYYNLGNVYQTNGEIGRAILSYRRAERLIPGDDHLRENLEAALARRVDADESGQLGEIVRTLTLRRYWLDASTTLALFVVTFLAVWGLLLLRLFVRIPLFRSLAFALGFVALLSAVGTGIYVVGEATDRRGVITSPETEARKGPGESYETLFTRPLHEGTEFERIGQRDDWWQIGLAGGDDAWIRAGDAAMVVPR